VVPARGLKRPQVSATPAHADAIMPAAERLRDGRAGDEAVGDDSEQARHRADQPEAHEHTSVDLMAETRLAVKAHASDVGRHGDGRPPSRGPVVTRSARWAWKRSPP
jgi:hypothetical protein